MTVIKINVINVNVIKTCQQKSQENIFTIITLWEKKTNLERKQC